MQIHLEAVQVFRDAVQVFRPAAQARLPIIIYMCMKNRLFSLWLSLLLPLAAGAFPVDAPTALRRAAGYFALAPQGRAAEAQAAIRLCGGDATVAERLGNAWLFTGAQGAFVLAAADDGLPPVLGYGHTAGGALPPALQAWERRTTLLQDGNGAAVSLSDEAGDQPVLGYGPPVEPLLPMVRDQYAPCNDRCPYYRYADGSLSESRCVVGCVATALEEILTYYRRPVVLGDTLFGWSTDHYDIPDLLPGTRVETSLIRNDYKGEYTAEEAAAVAELSYLCGVAARMNWGVTESGANIEHLVEPLRRALGIPYVHYADSYKYRPAEWIRMICDELHAGRPVLYTGYVMAAGGHAFVLDGLDENGFFHVNWGYGGNYDGYFRLDLLYYNEPSYDTTEESRPFGFFCNQCALLLCPDAVETSLPDTLARTGRDVVVEAVRCLQTPEAGKYTCLQLDLCNDTEETLTTPFEIFTNAPADTALFAQADFVALTGVTLRPGERRTVEVNATFSETGERVLRLSPDEVHLVAEMPLTVLPSEPARATVGAPQLDFPAEGTARVSAGISNAPDAGRAACNFAFGLYEGAGERTGEETRHIRPSYLEPGESATYTASFRGLKAGVTYTLLVRYPWNPVHTLRFTMPAVTGLTQPEAGEAPSEWYAPDGRRVDQPRQPSIYLERTGKRARKVWRGAAKN